MPSGKIGVKERCSLGFETASILNCFLSQYVRFTYLVRTVYNVIPTYCVVVV